MLDPVSDHLGMITAVSGIVVDLRNPAPAMFEVGDIARALSMQCRWIGQVNQFYSVAEHSFMVSLSCGSDPGKALWGLLHDAAEAYLGDLAGPIKHLPEFTAYRTLEKRIMAAICTRFNLPLIQPSVVSDVDLLIRTSERIFLKGHVARKDEARLSVELHGWSPAEAESLFLEQFHSLQSQTQESVKHGQTEFSTVS